MRHLRPSVAGRTGHKAPLRVGFTALALLAAVAVLSTLNALGATSALPDNAVQLDGANDHVTFGQATSTLGASNFTLETWFMRTGTGIGTGTGTGGLASAIPLVTKGRAESETANLNMNYFLGIDTTTNRLAVDFEDTATGGNHPLTANTTITNNVWHHAAATYDGTTWKIYLDGKLDGTLNVGAFTPESTSTQHAALGTAINSTTAGAQPAGFFQGLLDEARIWNVARTYEQIRANRNTETPSPTTGLRGYWHLDEVNPATTAADSSGNNVTGTLVNGASFVAGYTFPADAAPAAPQDVGAVARNAAVDLTWTANSDTDLVGYNVYRGTAPGVSTAGTPLNGDTPLTFTLPATPTYTDSTAVNGQIYYYAVTAIDTFNNKAATEVSATPSATLNALRFDGGTPPSTVGDYVTFGAAPALATPTFTIETWFKRTGTGIGQQTGTGGLVSAVPLVTKGRNQAEGTNQDMNYFLGIDTATNRLAVDFEEDVGGTGPAGQNHPLIANTPITNGVWHHAAATYDGTTWNIYLDGQPDGSLVVGEPARGDSVQHAALGTAMDSNGVPGGSFKGVLDEARIWNVARDQGQIQATMNQELTSGTGLIGRWGMNDGTGLTVANSVAGSPNGTATNGPDWVVGQTLVVDPPPTVTIVSAVPSTLGPADPSTDITWNASENGSYSVRVGGTTCANGTQVASGSYATSPANVQTNILASQLAEGANTIRVCVTDAGTNTGSATTTVTKNTIPAANALQFDGANDHVTFGQATSTLGASNFTLETWFMRTGTGIGTGTGTGGLASAIPLVTKGRAESETANLNMNYFLGIDTTTNRLAVDFEDTATGGNHPLTANTTITNNVWHHAAATYDGTTWKIYLDGKLDGTLNVGAFTPESTSTQHAALGTAINSTTAGAQPAGFFQGVLDEARIWNVARTGSQIRANKDSEAPTPNTGLRGHWHLDDGSPSTIAADSSGNNVTGTLTNGPTWVAGYGFLQDTTDPANPTGLDATGADSQVSLIWNDNAESDLAGYNLYRNTSSPVSVNGTPVNGTDLITDNAYTDTGLTNGQTYYYALVAVDTADNASGASGEDSATPLAAGGKALQFDGANDHVTFGQATSTLGASNFTLETWFMRTGTGIGTGTGTGGLASAIPLVTKGRAESETANLNMNYFLGIDTTTNRLAVDFEDTATGGNHPLTANTTITNNVWHHAAATYDGTTWKIYLDGKLDGTLNVGAFTPESTSTQHAALGTAINSTTAGAQPAGFFQGVLDEARIWNVARTGSQIRANKDSEAPTPNTGLRGHWHLDDGSPSTIAADSSGNGVTGTLTNGPTWVVGYGFPQDAIAPANPTGLDATGADSQVSLTWNDNAESDLAGYNLYRNTSSPVSVNGTPVNGTDLITDNAYTDTGLTNGQTYYYALVAVDSADNASGASNEDSATPQQVITDPVLVGAGDIADCTRTQDTATGALVTATPGDVFTIGDNAYDNGTAAEFLCYDAAWGAFKSRTRPTIGNHDFGNGSNPGAPNYFDYFNGAGQNNGPAGPRPDGYYSYDVSGNGVTWHVVVLNSECEPSGGYWLPSGCVGGPTPSTQEQWLRSDLANASTNNIIAMWHKPRFSSTGNHAHMGALYQALYDGGVDLVLGGHWHNYERLAPMNPSGNLDTTYGVRNFVIGTGGASLTPFGTILPTSEVRDNQTYGVMKFTLHANSYDFQFIPIAGQSFTDSGTNQPVHGPPPDVTPPTVTIVSAVPSTLGPSDPSTNITWHATENGTYSVRVGGADCSSGTQVATGSYATSPANVVTNILASQLAEGANTIRVCVTDAGPNTGSATTTVTKNTVPGANALDFDGSNDHVTFGQATSTLGATNFTLETWFRRTGTGTGTNTGSTGIPDAIPLIAKGRAEQDGSNVDMNYLLGIDQSSGVLVADFEDMASGANHPISGTTAIAVGPAWHHAAVSYDGTWRLYLDGKLEAKAAVGATPRSDSIQPASLASAITSVQATPPNEPAGFFDGELDEVRIWNVARTGSQIRLNKNSEAPTPNTGLRGHWHLDEGAPATTVSDSSGNNVTGTLTNGPAWVSGYAFPQDAIAPANPTGLDATGGDGQVSLTWNDNAESDLAGYNLYRNTSSPVSVNGTPVNGTDLITDNAYTDTGLTNGQTYYYALVAVDSADNASGASNEDSATPQQVITDPVFVGAGDIADCTRTQDTATAALVSGIPGQVWTAGDNVYQTGTVAEYTNCYVPTWGAFKDRTRPAIGNHDLGNGARPQPGAADPYFNYFNDAGNPNRAGDPTLGYYSYDVTGNGVTWHIVVLNSECEAGTGYWLPSGCIAGSTQEQWLRTDLANAPTNNIIAIWHKPRFSSTNSHAHMQALWQALYDGGVDIALAGHEHNYERFTPMNAAGAADATYGVRAFTVGTGGAALSSTSNFLPTSQVFNGSTYGVMKFTLHASSYDYQFIPIAGQTFTDAATNQPVHGPPPVTTPIVSIVSAVPSTIGASGSTNVTWNANENGTYSVRVGGTTCATGTQVANGSYATSPGNVVTNILASQLAEGANTIRVCVTDPQSNTGSATTIVTKDSVTPSVTIVSAVPSVLAPADPSTNITWNANENGTYSVRVGGTTCATGTQVANGSYATSPANVVTNILASQLAEGTNTIRVCVTDTANNTGSNTINVTKSSAPPPAFRSSASATNGVASLITINKPTGTALNDVLVATIDVIAVPTITPPLGWTLIRSDVSGTGSGDLRQSSYYHVVGVSEPAMYTFDFSAAHGASGAILAYSGVDTSAPIDASSGATSTTASISAPLVNTTGSNRMIVGLFGQNGQRTFTPPAGMTERHELSLTTPPGEKVTSESADAIQAAAGASGAKTATSSSTGRGVGHLVALKPGGGGGGGPGPNPPVIDSVVINQSNPTTNQVLSATVTSHDPDPGDTVTYTYAWKKNGSTVGTAATLDLSVANNGDKGDSITLQVTGSDGTHTSAAITSSAVTVVNSPPTATVQLNTSTPTTNQVLTATATKADPDAADTVLLTYVWKKNGNVMQTSLPTTSLTDTYDLAVPTNGDDGDVISVEVTPHDGTVAGSLVSASATVGTPTAIAFRSAATAKTNGVAPSITVPVPAGTTSGDVLVAQIVSASSGTVTAPVGGGWALIRTDVNTASASVYRQSLYYHVAGAEPANYTWTLAASHGATGAILAYSGVSNATPINANGATIGSSSVTAVVAPSVTTTVANTMLVGFYSINGGRTFVPPVGMSERSDIAENLVAGDKVTGESADELRAPIGATNARTATANQAGWGIGALIALRPPP